MSAQELQTINGIGPKFATLLAAGGVTSIADLAGRRPEELAQIAPAPEWRQPDYAGWIQQAQALAGAPVVEPQAATPAAETPAAAPARKRIDQAELQAIIAELNQLAADLQKIMPGYAPPPYSPQKMLSLLKTNVDRFTPDAVRSLQESLEGTSIEDFRDIETWKGMWFTLNYLVQLEAKELTAGLGARLSGLPGVRTLHDLKEMLADTPPEEFLKVDTWKGMWFVLNYELQHRAQEMRRRLLGSEEDE